MAHYTYGKTDYKVCPLSRTADTIAYLVPATLAATFEPRYPRFNPAVTRIGSHLESSLFARLNPVAKLKLFHRERSHLLSTLHSTTA